MSCSGSVSQLPAAEPLSVSGLYDLIAVSPERRIAVIGLVKNAGKTTVVNALMANVGQRFGLPDTISYFPWNK